MCFNRTLVEKVDEEDSKINNENYKFLGSIIKEKDKFYFVPLLIELGSEKESINDVPWLIYNSKPEPEINHSYILNEGDVLKMGNAIFIIKMIQINENENKNNKKDNVTENNNNTLLISGSANHSLDLNKFNNDEINIAAKTIDIKRIPNNDSEKKEKMKGDPSPKQELPTTSEKIDEKNKNIKNNKNKICRICYQEEDDNLINPLIRPCKCSGSMKYIHLKCLLHWLKSRTANGSILSNTNENFNAYYINQKTECELCKQLFPDYIKHNDIKYCLIDFDYAQESKIKENNNNNKCNQNSENTNMDININNNSKSLNENNNNFIVIDTVFPLTDTNKYRYIVKFDNNNELKIGRGLDNQLVLNEITVSRNHCLLKLQKNKYNNYEIEMEDKSSKFGSLILLQSNKVEIIKGRPLHIQISNVHLIIQYKKNISLLSCCNVEVVDEKNSYEKINNKAVKNKNIVKILTEVESDDGEDNKNTKEKKDGKNTEKGKDNKINKKSDSENKMVLLINNNNSNLIQKDKENMKTIPKETCEKRESNEIKENKDENNKDSKKEDNNLNENKDNKDNNKDENKKIDDKNENNKELVNDSIDVEEENEKNN